MTPWRRRIRLHPHKTAWQFNWRNPDMDVMRFPQIKDPVSGKLMGRTVEILDKEESSAISRDTLKYMQGRPAYPDWRNDPSYFWNKKGRNRK